jgi:hypothetical protein
MDRLAVVDCVKVVVNRLNGLVIGELWIPFARIPALRRLAYPYSFGRLDLALCSALWQATQHCEPCGGGAGTWRCLVGAQGISA